MTTSQTPPSALFLHLIPGQNWDSLALPCFPAGYRSVLSTCMLSFAALEFSASRASGRGGTCHNATESRFLWGRQKFRSRTRGPEVIGSDPGKGTWGLGRQVGKPRGLDYITRYALSLEPLIAQGLAATSSWGKVLERNKTPYGSFDCI